MATITKKYLVDKILEKHPQFAQQDIKQVVQLFLDSVTEELSKGNRLEFRNFGVFEVVRRSPRVAQNPKTLEKVFVPARNAVKFKPGKVMRERIQEK